MLKLMLKLMLLTMKVLLPPAAWGIISRMLMGGLRIDRTPGATVDACRSGALVARSLFTQLVVGVVVL